MDLYQILGYFSALIVGLVLGLIGGGGSILTLPILVYFIGLNPVIATAYSLFIVGTTSLVGAIKNYRNNMVDLRTTITFSIPAFIAVYFTRRYIIPAIPDSLFSIFRLEVTKDIFIMTLFAIIMLMASFSMIRSKNKIRPNKQSRDSNYLLISIEGVLVGILTGVVGAGGGFLIIPALVLLANLPMKLAVGTSLVIISIKSLIGFLGDVQNLEIDWAFLLIFTGISMLGILIGVNLTKFISGNKLKKGFGWFTLVMAVYIIYMEFK